MSNLELLELHLNDCLHDFFFHAGNLGNLGLTKISSLAQTWWHSLIVSTFLILFFLRMSWWGDYSLQAIADSFVEETIEDGVFVWGDSAEDVNFACAEGVDKEQVGLNLLVGMLCEAVFSRHLIKASQK